MLKVRSASDKISGKFRENYPAVRISEPLNETRGAYRKSEGKSTIFAATLKATFALMRFCARLADQREGSGGFGHAEAH